MNAVIIATHQVFASGVYKTINMIAGKFDNVEIVEFLENDTYETIDKKYDEAYEKLKSYKNIVVLTDILGGTPFNRAVMKFSESENVDIISGLNFAMLYEAITNETEDINSYVEQIIDTAKNSIEVYKQPEKKEDLEEDGI